MRRRKELFALRGWVVLVQNSFVQLACTDSIGNPVEFPSWRMEWPNSVRCFIAREWRSLGDGVYTETQ